MLLRSPQQTAKSAAFSCKTVPVKQEQSVKYCFLKKGFLSWICSSPTRWALLFTGQSNRPDSQIQSSQVPLLCIYWCCFKHMWFCLEACLGPCLGSPPSYWDNLLTLICFFVPVPSVFSHSLSLWLLFVVSCCYYLMGRLRTVITNDSCIHFFFCPCRSPRSPGRGGLLFPPCLRMLSGRPGVCLPKRYYNPAVSCVCLGLTQCQTHICSMTSGPF